jgi:hypothetical protein
MRAAINEVEHLEPFREIIGGFGARIIRKMSNTPIRFILYPGWVYKREASDVPA